MKQNKKPTRKNALQKLIDEVLKAHLERSFKYLSFTGKKVWLARLKKAIKAFNSKNFLDYQSKTIKSLRHSYKSYYTSGFVENNKGLKSWRADTLKPLFRKQLRERINDSLMLIKTQNSSRMGVLEARFLNWLESKKQESTTSLSLRETMKVDKTIRQNDKHYNMILKDQTRKMIGNFDHIVAEHYQAIGFFWKTRKDNRVVGNPSGKYPKSTANKMHGDHYDRADKFYFYKDTWALKKHLIDTKHKDFAYAEFEDGLPGQPINCRCYAYNIYDIEDVPEKFIKNKAS